MAQQVSYDAWRANDGTWTNLIGDPRCTHSGLETNPWWAVDLGVPLSVQEVILTNRLGSGECVCVCVRACVCVCVFSKR